jgi:hypothetical protein
VEYEVERGKMVLGSAFFFGPVGFEVDPKSPEFWAQTCL